MTLLSRAAPPTEEDMTLASESSRKLAHSIASNNPTSSISLVHDGNSCEAVMVPTVALQLFIEMLAQMAQGNIVTIFPIHAELTTQEAADLLNVSRPFLVKQIEAGEIPFRKIGKHRRIKFQDLMDYKERMDSMRNQSLDELVAQAQELNMGYE